MAKIQEETVTIKLSRLIKNTESDTQAAMAQPEIISALEQVVQELVGDSIIVEVTQE